MQKVFFILFECTFSQFSGNERRNQGGLGFDSGGAVV